MVVPPASPVAPLVELVAISIGVSKPTMPPLPASAKQWLQLEGLWLFEKFLPYLLQ